MGSPITDESLWGAKSRNIFFFKNAVTLFLLLFASAIAFTHFDTYSAATRMYFILLELTKGPIKSMPHTSNNLITKMGFKGSSCFLEMPPSLCYHMPWRTHEDVGEWLATSSHIARSCEQFGYHYDATYRRRMACLQNTQLLNFRHTMPNKPIGTTLI